MDLLTWLYYAAAGWYVAYVITNTRGPFGVFEKARNWRGGRWHGRSEDKEGANYDAVRKIYWKYNFDGLLDCIICLLPWAVLILRLIGVNIITDVLAIAAVALWLHGYTGWRHNIS